MYELLRNLRPGDRVLDLGCATGSFNLENASYAIIRVDLDRPPATANNFVQADAAKLPFPDHSFNAVISNHSLEHFDNLEASLQEIGRIIKPDGSLYVAVPDASTFSDRLYRWLASGGGHVNAFRSAPQLAAKIEQSSGLKHVVTKTLCTSLSCLNRNNRRTRAPRRLLLLGNGTEISLRAYSYLSRLCDHLLNTRLSVYGWAFYFGNIEGAIDTGTATNVCIRCGSGHPSRWLQQHTRLERRFLLFTCYRCPDCSTTNLFSEDTSLQYSCANDRLSPPAPR